MFEYYQIPYVSNSPKYDNLLRKSAILYQSSINNLNIPNPNEDFRITKNELIEVFIEILDDWLDLELEGFTNDGNTIKFTENVDHVDGYKLYPLYTKIDTDISLD